MTTSNRKVVHIADKAEQKVLSKAQKQFNNLIKKIDDQKKRLREWQETIPQYNQRVEDSYQPLMDSFNNYRVEWLHSLDSAYDNKAFNKTDKKKLRHILEELSYELIFDHGKEELKELYNKYAEGSDFDNEKEMLDEVAQGMMKAMMQEMGIEVDGEIDLSSPEQIQALLKEKMQEKENQQEQAEQGKKTAKQLKKESKQKQEQEDVSKSIREVYRKLAASLHPDRELDEQERERKTRLMQKVNAAYAKKDLLGLLELQLEIEQIDQSHLNNIAEDRLKHFNKILKEQLDELLQEVEQIEYSFRLQINIPPFGYLNPKSLMKCLDNDMKKLQFNIKYLQADIKLAQNSTALKAWLKSYRIPKASDDPFDFLF
jgi:hypothetical protein